MFQPNEAKALLEFLNRSSITGHTEREVMNLLVSKLEVLANPLPQKKEEDE